jgi:hypothetical protein
MSDYIVIGAVLIVALLVADRCGRIRAQLIRERLDREEAEMLRQREYQKAIHDRLKQ